MFRPAFKPASLALTLLLSVLCALFQPVLADDEPAGKGKKVKAPKREATEDTAPKPLADVDDKSVDKVLDSFLKGVPKPPPLPANEAPAATTAPAPDTSIPAAQDTSIPGAPDVSSGPQAPVVTRTEREWDNTPADSDGNIPDKTVRAGELNNKAIDAMNAKDFPTAIQLFKQALVADPSYVNGKRNLCVCYFNYAVEFYNTGKYALAIPQIEQALVLAKQVGRDDTEMKRLHADCKQAVAEEAGSKK